MALPAGGAGVGCRVLSVSVWSPAPSGPHALASSAAPTSPVDDAAGGDIAAGAAGATAGADAGAVGATGAGAGSAAGGAAGGGAGMLGISVAGCMRSTSPTPWIVMRP